MEVECFVFVGNTSSVVIMVVFVSVSVPLWSVVDLVLSSLVDVGVCVFKVVVLLLLVDL